MMRSRARSGQATIEFALLYAGVIFPLLFGTIFVSEMFWVWHSVTEFTRDGARYAATHCWQSGNSNLLAYMQSHVPRMIDMNQFQTGGSAQIVIEYFQRDPETGQLTSFAGCSADCSVTCVPDSVTISVTDYQFGRFVSFLRLPPVVLPAFPTSLPIESNGCDQDGNCQ
jgi:Flp pilus assembly protein TadG